jgi:signal transduction histidine kinase
MRFRSQLVVGHTALLFATLLTGSIAVVALHLTSTRLENVTRELADDMFTIERLHVQAELLVASSRGYLHTGDARSLTRLDEAARSVDDSLTALRHRADLTADVDRIESAARTYVRQARAAAEARTPLFEESLAPARARFEEAIDRFARREQSDFDKESRAARAFAQRTEGLVAATTVLGVLLGVVLAWISIRKLNAQYAREREATAVARRAAAARDDLLAIVSHDLRTPLATITMGTSMLDESTEEPRPRKHIRAISNAAQRMQHLIDELLDVAKLESGTFELRREPCDARSLIEATVSLFQARAIDAQIDLVVDADGIAPVVADRERVLQVLSNLVANAFKFTRAGGTITITARPTGPTGDRVRFEVQDTGVGIPEDQQAHLFERYWQGTRLAPGGVGLGLYICKQLVEAHHGQIGVDSRPGEGATFWFTLPAG